MNIGYSHFHHFLLLRILSHLLAVASDLCNFSLFYSVRKIKRGYRPLNNSWSFAAHFWVSFKLQKRILFTPISSVSIQRYLYIFKKPSSSILHHTALGSAGDITHTFPLGYVGRRHSLAQFHRCRSYIPITCCYARLVMSI